MAAIAFHDGVGAFITYLEDSADSSTIQEVSGGDQLVEIIQDYTPQIAVANGRVPSAVQILLKTTGDGQADAGTSQLVAMASIIRLNSGIIQVQDQNQRGQPNNPKITDADGLTQAYYDSAEAIWQAIQGPLTGFYNMSKTQTETVNLTTTSSALHAILLDDIFKPYNLPQSVLTQLDTVLTNFAKTISPYAGQDPGGRAFAVAIHSVDKIDVSEDDSRPDWTYQPKITVVHLNVEADSFRNALLKQGNQFNFEFELNVMTGELNVDELRSVQPKFEKIIQFLTKGTGSMGLTDYGNKILNTVSI